jgi:hypothetical protein
MRAGNAFNRSKMPSNSYDDCESNLIIKTFGKHTHNYYFANGSRIDRCPRRLTERVELGVDAGQRRPNLLEREHIGAQRLETIGNVGNGAGRQRERLAGRREASGVGQQRVGGGARRGERCQCCARLRRGIARRRLRPGSGQRLHFGDELRAIAFDARRQRRNLRGGSGILAPQQLVERRPLAVEHRKVEPIGGERVSLSLEQRLTGLQRFAARRPLGQTTLDVLQRHDKLDGGGRRRRVERLLLERGARRRQLVVAGAHRHAESRAKLAQHVAMPIVVLVVDAGLHRRVVDQQRPDLTLRLRIVECDARAFDLDQNASPSLHIVAQSFEQRRRLQIPQRLCVCACACVVMRERQSHTEKRIEPDNVAIHLHSRQLHAIELRHNRKRQPICFDRHV